MGRKILFIAHQRNFDGGASRSLIAIIDELKKNYNIEPIVLVPFKGEISKVLEEKEIRYYANYYFWWMNGKTIKSQIKGQLGKYINKFLFFLIYKNLKKEKFDLIYTNTSVIDIGFYLSQKMNLKHIFHVREFGEEDHGLRYLNSEEDVKQKIISSNTEIITISKELQNKYLKLFPKKKIHLIYNGLVDFWKEKKEMLEIQTINFVLVGSINEGKNQIEVIKAADILKQKGIKNFKVEIIGSGDINYEAYLKKLVSEKKLQNNISFIGKISKEEIITKLNKVHVGLMLSKKEAFGRVTVEYMLASLIVIASNSGANPEIIRDGVDGYLYDLGSGQDLASKMENIIRDYSKHKKIAEQGRIKALKNYTVEKNVKNINSLIENLILK